MFILHQITDFQKKIDFTFQQYFIIYFKNLRESFKNCIEGLFIGTTENNKNPLNFQKNMFYGQTEINKNVKKTKNLSKQTRNFRKKRQTNF